MIISTRRIWLLLLAFAAVIQSSSDFVVAQDPAPEDLDIQVVEAKWGFDGFSRYRTFVPLRIILKNRSAQQKTLQLRLSREDSLNTVGERLEQEVTVSPETTRIVQMTPFVSDPGDTWTLRWGDGEAESMPIKSDSADDGIVYIASTSELIQRSGSLPFMKEDEFPTSITHLDSLRAVFLDHEPDWTGARRKAFQEWLLKGGKVVILDQTDGSSPKFANGYEYLNINATNSTYGMGVIQRLHLPAQQVARSTIEKEVLGRELTGGNLEQKLKVYTSMSERRSFNQATGAPDPITTLSYSRDKVLTELKELAGTRPRWGLIYLAVILYVAWQWRIGWLWGLMEKKPGRFYTWTLGLALSFSAVVLLYGHFSARGNDRAITVAIARRLSPGLFDVEGWTVVGTGLKGGEHQLVASGTGQLYGGAESFGQNPILIRDSEMMVNLAAFSTQKVAFRSRVEMPDIPVNLHFAGSEMWQTKSVEFSFDSPRRIPVYAAAVAIGRRIYEFSMTNGRLTPTDRWGEEMNQRLDPFSVMNIKRNASARWRFLSIFSFFDSVSAEEAYDNAFQDVIGNAFSVGTMVFHDSFVVPSGYARIMLYTDLPPALRLKGDFPDQSGRMLYVTDVPLAGAQ